MLPNVLVILFAGCLKNMIDNPVITLCDGDFPCRDLLRSLVLLEAVRECAEIKKPPLRADNKKHPPNNTINYPVCLL